MKLWILLPILTTSLWALAPFSSSSANATPGSALTQRDSCLLQLFVKLARTSESDTPSFRHGQMVMVRTADYARPLFLRFLGKINTAEDSNLLFHHPQSGELFAIPLSATDIHAGKVKLSNGDFAPLIEISQQWRGTCATHACVNGIKVLRAMNREPHLTRGISEKDLFDTIEKIISKVSTSPGEEKTFNFAKQMTNVHLLMKRLFGEVPEITAEQKNFKPRLLDHLNQGGIAWISYRTNKGRTISRDVTRLGPQGSSIHETFVHSEPTGQGTDGHAVLAVGTIPNGRGGKSLIILDSAPGKLLLWDEGVLDQWKTSLNTALLIDPKKLNNSPLRLPGEEPPREIAYYDPAKNFIPISVTKGYSSRFEPPRGLGTLVGSKIKCVTQSDGNQVSLEGIITQEHSSFLEVWTPSTGKAVKVTAKDVEAISVLPPKSGSWKPVTDHATQLGFAQNEKSQYALMRIAISHDNSIQSDYHTLYGRLVTKEVIPGYFVYEITDPNGVIHLIDPNATTLHGSRSQVIYSLHVIDASGFSTELQNLHPPKSLVVLNRQRVLEGSQIPFGKNGVPFPNPIIPKCWSEARFYEFLLLLKQRDTPFSIVDRSGNKYSFLRIEGELEQGWSFTLRDQKSNKTLSLYPSDIREIFPEPNAPEKIEEVMIGDQNYLDYVKQRIKKSHDDR